MMHDVRELFCPVVEVINRDDLLPTLVDHGPGWLASVTGIERLCSPTVAELPRRTVGPDELARMRVVLQALVQILLGRHEISVVVSTAKGCLGLRHSHELRLVYEQAVWQEGLGMSSVLRYVS